MVPTLFIQALGIRNVVHFDFMTGPPPESLAYAICYIIWRFNGRISLFL